MLYEVSREIYHNLFRQDLNLFISIRFIDLNKKKVDKLVYLVNDKNKASVGIVFGKKDNELLCPFSAPFGGFHYRHEKISPVIISDFLTDLKTYCTTNEIKKIEIVLPPDIYGQSINAKLVNALIRNGFHMLLPELTNIGDLKAFNGEFTDYKSRKCFRQAEKHSLIFRVASTLEEKSGAYDIILKNRQWLKRPMSMTFKEVMDISKIWDVDFFFVTNDENKKLSAAIFYRAHKKIVQAIWWGDVEEGRGFRAMDFLCNHLWKYYKALEYEYIDLGISTEDGIPNDGLLRFKESLDAYTSLKFRFVLYNH